MKKICCFLLVLLWFFCPTLSMLAVTVNAMPQTPWTNSECKRYAYCQIKLEDQSIELGTNSDRCILPKKPTSITGAISDGQFVITSNPQAEHPAGGAMILSLGGELDAELLKSATGAGFYFENKMTDGVWIIAAQCYNGYYTRLGENQPYTLISAENLASPSTGYSPNQGQIYIPAGFRGYVLYELANMTERFDAPEVRTGMIGLRFGGVPFDEGQQSMLWDDFFVWGENLSSFDPMNIPMLTGLTVQGADLGNTFTHGRQNYYALAQYTTTEVTVSATVPEQTTLLINGKTVDSGSPFAIALATGNNTVLLQAQNQRGEKTEVTLRIERPEDPAALYTDAYRPILHFTPYRYSMNDPNGLVYNAATSEYHMYFQCDRPIDSAWAVDGNQKSWGHAVSKDLVSWTELDPVLMPDENGTIWSGSCVIDKHNTSGLFSSDTPADARMVALYTYYGGTKPQNGLCSIGLAYSTDNGASFNKPFADPIIPNTGNMYQAGMRDPKVFWLEDTSYEDGGTWVMVVAGGRTQLFTSPDLIHWQHDRELNFKDGDAMDSECPDLYPLAVDGDTNNVKWIYSGGGVFYLIGELSRAQDGKLDYKAETQKLQTVNGVSELFPGSGLSPEMYATQSFYNDAQGRRVEISWLRDTTTISTKPWFGAQSLALEVGLETVNGQLALVKYPVSELNNLRTETLFEIKNLILNQQSQNPLSDLSLTVYDLEAVIDMQQAEGFEFRLRTGSNKYLSVRYDAKTQQLYTDKTKAGSYLSGIYQTTLVPKDGKITLRIVVDTSIVDVFGNGGQTYHNGFTFADPSCSGLSLQALGGQVTVDSLTIYGMRSIRSDAPETPNSPQPSSPPDDNQGNNAWIIILGLAVAAVVCTIVIMLVSARKKS